MAHRQGFALVAALMILALLSVLCAATLQSTTLETQISAGDRDSRLALYVARSALREARYYAARGWGKVSLLGSSQVVVDTPLVPGLSWDTDLYQGFTLIDSSGTGFRVLSHSGTLLSPTLTLDTSGGAPMAGRFSLLREIPAGTWSSPYLVVEDDVWASHSPSDCWKNWTLWNAAGTGFRIVGSSLCPSATGSGLALRLKLSKDPGVGPHVLSLNPWVRALAAGAATLPGDADPGGLGWSRAFATPEGDLGTGVVVASAESPGQYLLTATGRAGNRQRQVVARVYRSGRADQHISDWAVQ